MSRPILTVVPDPTPSRFDAHRQTVSDRATLELCASVAKQAKDAATRAEALFNTASGSDEPARAKARQSAVESARLAWALLGEILGEFS